MFLARGDLIEQIGYWDMRRLKEQTTKPWGSMDILSFTKQLLPPELSWLLPEWLGGTGHQEDCWAWSYHPQARVERWCYQKPGAHRNSCSEEGTSCASPKRSWSWHLFRSHQARRVRKYSREKWQSELPCAPKVKETGYGGKKPFSHSSIFHSSLDSRQTPSATWRFAGPHSSIREGERRWPWQWRTTGEVTNAVHVLKSVGINILHTWCGWREETDVVLQGVRRTNVFSLSG